ncbi:MAG TPA: helix-turn-helix domain-containing protein [Anaerolineales bacterium]|nr:helix-turn-helix domain-containing protein [Anaerolineales bacterium]
MTLNDKSMGGVMTVKDLAQYLKISESKVYRMVNASQIPAFRVGKSWRFTRLSIDSWIQHASQLLMDA